MQMKKKIREQGASMAVYVSIVLLGFIFLLTAMFMSSSSVRKEQLQTILRIKQSYEIDNKNIEEIYQTQLGKLKDTVPPDATITVASTAVLTNGSITATVLQEDNKNKLDLSNCRYIYNTSSVAIGTDASSYTGGTLSSESNSLTLRATTAGTYYLHTLTVDTDGNATETISSPVKVISTESINYASANTTSNPYSTFTAPADGTYKLQVWGAQGGSYSTTYYGGKGGYSVGNVTLSKGDKLYVYVGGQPTNYNSSATSGNTNEGGYNGGGAGRTYYYSSTYSYGLGGGGATDIRIGGNTYYYRLIVAGGGSGSTNGSTGYAGGGTDGVGYSSSYYGTQTAAGTGGAFGTGGASAGRYNYKYGASGGGGGWYGGGAGTGQSDSSSAYRKYSGGGSGFVWTSSTASNAPSGYSVATQYYLSSASTTAGNASFESTSGGTETGHSGDGYAKITPISVSGPSSTTSSKDNV